MKNRIAKTVFALKFQPDPCIVDCALAALLECERLQEGRVDTALVRPMDANSFWSNQRFQRKWHISGSDQRTAYALHRLLFDELNLTVCCLQRHERLVCTDAIERVSCKSVQREATSRTGIKRANIGGEIEELAPVLLIKTTPSPWIMEVILDLLRVRLLQIG